MIPFANVGSYSLAEVAIGIIILIAVIAIVVIFIKVSGVPIPVWVWHIMGIIVAAVLCILAIKFLVSV